MKVQQKERSLKHKKPSINSSKKNTYNKAERSEVSAIIVVAVSVFFAFTFFLKHCDITGKVGEFLRDFFWGLSGDAAYVVPFLLFWFGFKLCSQQSNSRAYQAFLLFVFWVSSANIISLLNYRDVVTADTVSQYYNYGKCSIGGGFLGDILCCHLLVPAFGKFGNWLISLMSLFVVVVIMTKISLSALVKSLTNKLKDKILCFLSENQLETSEIDDENKQSVKTKKVELSPSAQSINSDDYFKNYFSSEYNESASMRKNREKITEQLLDEPQEKSQIEVKTAPAFDFDRCALQQQDFKAGSCQYQLPPIDLLSKPIIVRKATIAAKRELEEKAKKLLDTLRSFGVEATILNVAQGPTVTRFELQPGVGVKVNKITNLSVDIALSLAAAAVRIEAPIPGKSAVGVEIPNNVASAVSAREVIDSEDFVNFPSKTAFALGKDISGAGIVADIAEMPHLLIAGATGSGKSVCINTLITSILYKAKPNEVKMIMVDPKMVELGGYNGIPHLLIPVVTDPKRAAGALNWAVTEMKRRYELFKENKVKNIKSFNSKFKTDARENYLPEIIIIIDELADLMMVARNEVEDSINSLAALARAAGMYLVIATQRPSVNVITGVIKANVPSRISFAVSSQVDSRTILDSVGAEKLLGRGDMLYYPRGASKPTRVQGNFVSDKEVEKIVEYVKQFESDNYSEDVIEQIDLIEDNQKNDNHKGEKDEFLQDAITFAVEAGQVSASALQRKFKIGYNRACRIVDQMEERGLIGLAEGSKPRKVIIIEENGGKT